jgi:membrane protein DedA with SNARE-associated domain
VAALCPVYAAAALLWALHASLLGYFGGKAFEGAARKGLLLALGIAFPVAGGLKIVRSYRGAPRAGNRLEPDT